VRVSGGGCGGCQVSKAQRLLEEPVGRRRGRGNVVAAGGCRDGRHVGRPGRSEYAVDGKQ